MSRIKEKKFELLTRIKESVNEVNKNLLKIDCSNDTDDMLEYLPACLGGIKNINKLLTCYIKDN